MSASPSTINNSTLETKKASQKVKAESPSQSSKQVAPDSPTSFGALGKLPLEIRSMIYNHALAKDTALTRTSKALSSDTKAALHHHGICRIVLDYKRYTTTSDPSTYYTASSMHWTGYFCSVRHQPPPPVLAQISNIELRIYFSEPIQGGGREMRPKDFTAIVAGIIAAMKERKTCYVKMMLASHVEFKGELGMLKAMLLFRDFESVTVELCKQPLYPSLFSLPGFWVWDEVVDDFRGVRLLNALLLPEGKGKGSQKLSILRSHVEDPGVVEVLWDNEEDAVE